MTRFGLPENPVDGYKIEWWTHVNGEKVRHEWAIYHINTPWIVFDPDSNMNGADLVDDWMIYYESDFDGKTHSSCRGRWCGWNQPNEGKWGTFFSSWLEAASYVKSELEKTIERQEELLYRYRNKLSRIVEEINSNG